MLKSTGKNTQVGTTTWLAHFLHLSPLSPEERAAVNTSKLLHSVVPQLFRIKPSQDVR